MEKNLIVLCLDGALAKSAANLLADSLDMYFLDINDSINYNLQVSAIKQKIGIKYLNSQIKGLIKNSCTYENTVINLPFEFFLKPDIQKIVLNSNSIIFHIEIDKQCLQDKKSNINIDKIPKIAFDEYIQLLKNAANVNIEYNGQTMCNLAEQIKESLKNQ
ncbi:MAG: hypothetical protein E7378_02980 [Clostridiales bacterium]|nr:hypothetical protein [Clostridiales bacterium]